MPATTHRTGLGSTGVSRPPAVVQIDEALIQELVQCGFRVGNLARNRGRSLRQFERDCRPRTMIHEIRMKLAVKRLRSGVRVKEVASYAHCRFYVGIPKLLPNAAIARHPRLKKPYGRASVSRLANRMWEKAK